MYPDQPLGIDTFMVDTIRFSLRVTPIWDSKFLRACVSLRPKSGGNQTLWANLTGFFSYSRNGLQAILEHLYLIYPFAGRINTSLSINASSTVLNLGSHFQANTYRWNWDLQNRLFKGDFRTAKVQSTQTFRNHRNLLW